MAPTTRVLAEPLRWPKEEQVAVQDTSWRVHAARNSGRISTTFSMACPRQAILRGGRVKSPASVLLVGGREPSVSLSSFCLRPPDFGAPCLLS